MSEATARTDHEEEKKQGKKQPTRRSLRQAAVCLKPEAACVLLARLSLSLTDLFSIHFSG